MAGYGTDNGFNTWLSDNGYVLPVGAPLPAVLRNRGSTYIDAVYGPRFSGYPTGGVDQERAWPRTDAYAYGTALSASDVPQNVQRAAYAAAWHEANNPGSLTAAASASGAVKREKVGSLEVEYVPGSGENAAADATVIISSVEGLLSPFFAVCEPAVLVV